MIRKVPVIVLTFLIALGCVELYDFNVENGKSSLVIEGEISDVSYRDYLKFLADGRHFMVKLSRTSDVDNVRDEKIRDAEVFLLDNRDHRWDYTSSEMNPGFYYLFDDDFRAEPGVSYQLKVILSGEESYQSDWEQMPEVESGPLGDIDFEEVVTQKYVFRNNERVLGDVRGVNVRVDLPEVISSDPVYYRWTFSATWVFRATLVSITEDDYRCWITNPSYLSNYVLLKDNTGGYKNKLFIIDVDHNDRIFDRISILISQYTMPEGYFNYWEEIQEQDDRTGLFDPPPFNLQSNLHADNSEQDVFGYFGVVHEQGTRWDFSRLDLSYPVKNTWREYCTNPNIILGPYSECLSCFNYALGIPTNVKPYWWDE